MVVLGTRFRGALFGSTKGLVAVVTRGMTKNDVGELSVDQTLGLKAANQVCTQQRE